MLPHVFIGEESVNVFEVAGRARCDRYLASGGNLDELSRCELERLRSLAAPGRGRPKERLKALKKRPCPALTFEFVTIDPRVAEALKPEAIKGLLTKYKRLHEHGEWKDAYNGTSCDFRSLRHPGCSFHVQTFFFDKSCHWTLIVLVPPGQQPPDIDATMERATASFDWDAIDAYGRDDDWLPLRAKRA
jgi:hypothetical protein